MLGYNLQANAAILGPSTLTGGEMHGCSQSDVYRLLHKQCRSGLWVHLYVDQKHVICVTTGHVGAICPKLYSGRPPLLADVQVGAAHIPLGGCIQWQPVDACCL